MDTAEICPSKTDAPADERGEHNKRAVPRFQRTIRQWLFASCAAISSIIPIHSADASKNKSEPEFSVNCNLKTGDGKPEVFCSGEDARLDSLYKKSKKELHAVVKVTRDGLMYTCPGSFENPSASAGLAPSSTLMCYPPSKKDLAVEVDVPGLQLTLFQEGRVVKVLPISPGKDDTPTPDGHFRVEEKEDLYIKRVVKPGEPRWQMPMWLGLGNGIGIHSIPHDPERPNYAQKARRSIGRRKASHGCIRMNPLDAEYLYAHVPVGVAVHIINPDFCSSEKQAKAAKVIF